MHGSRNPQRMKKLLADERSSLEEGEIADQEFSNLREVIEKKNNLREVKRSPEIQEVQEVLEAVGIRRSGFQKDELHHSGNF